MWVCVGVRVAYGGVQGSRLYKVGWNQTEKSVLAEGGLEKESLRICKSHSE